jgi:uncharacterized protein (DUF2384 family)
MEALDLNQIKNRFDILDSSKQNMIRPHKLREFIGGSIGVDELAQSLGKSRASMYRDSIKLNKEFIETYLIPIVWAADIAYELFNGDKEKARNWMLTPNSYFFGKSPFNICLVGDGKAVIDLLLERSGRG